MGGVTHTYTRTTRQVIIDSRWRGGVRSYGRVEGKEEESSPFCLIPSFLHLACAGIHFCPCFHPNIPPFLPALLPLHLNFLHGSILLPFLSSFHCLSFPASSFNFILPFLFCNMFFWSSSLLRADNFV